MATSRSKQAKNRHQGTSRPAEPSAAAEPATVLAQYGCGPVQFSGTSDALYERHLLFDSVRDLTSAGARERFEAVARSVRDVLSQRWIRTAQTYECENPKRIYYLSMEFLIGRSLANNILEREALHRDVAMAAISLPAGKPAPPLVLVKKFGFEPERVVEIARTLVQAA